MVRATIAAPNVVTGEVAASGLTIATSTTSGAPADAAISRSVFQRNDSAGITVGGATATIDATVVRDQAETGNYSHGIQVTVDYIISNRPADVTISRSLVERVGTTSLLINGADVHVEGLLSREPIDGVSFRRGALMVQWSADVGAPAALTMRDSAVESPQLLGLGVFSSTVTVDNTRISGSRATNEGLFGDGVSLLRLPGVQTDSLATFDHMLIEASARAGISNYGGALTLSSSTLECNAIQLMNARSRTRMWPQPPFAPLSFQPPPPAVVSSSMGG